MDLIRKIIEMFRVHIVSNCKCACCETKVELEISDSESGSRGSSRSNTPEPRFPIDQNDLRKKAVVKAARS